MRKDELEWWRNGPCSAASVPSSDSDSVSDELDEAESSREYRDINVAFPTSLPFSSSSSSTVLGELAKERIISRAFGVPSSFGASDVELVRSRTWRDGFMARPLLCGAIGKESNIM